jgi:hypothetical protein
MFHLLVNRLLEFTFRLGTSNAQCFGTTKTDLDRGIKSILLLSSCSNGVHWTIIDLFRITDILAPDFGFSLLTKFFQSLIWFYFTEQLVEFYLKKKQKVTTV